MLTKLLLGREILLNISFENRNPIEIEWKTFWNLKPCNVKLSNQWAEIAIALGFLSFCGAGKLEEPPNFMFSPNQK